VQERLVHAVARGEVHADVDAGRLIEIIGGATLIRLLLDPGGQQDDAWVEQTAAIISHGVKADQIPLNPCTCS
jgi:Tetracyclin repressor-like, C-terminal domain